MNKQQAIEILKGHVADVVADKRAKGGFAIAGANQIEESWNASFAKIEEQLTDADFANVSDEISVNELAVFALGELR